MRCWLSSEENITGSSAPAVKSCLLPPAPSCNKISGEDLRLRGSSRASFRACASSTYSTLGGTPFWFSLHLSAAVFQAERRACPELAEGISRYDTVCNGRSLGPL